MKKTSLLFCSVFSLISLTVYATPFAEQFTTLAESQLPTAGIALIIQDLTTGQVLFQHRAQENFHPASNLKLFTAAAALKGLGKDFQFQTTLHQKGDNVYLCFRGDPSLSSQDLFQLLKALQNQKITEIKGHFIIDDTAFDNITFAPGWTRDSTSWYYAAPVHSIIINENKVRVDFAETKNLNQKILISQKDKALAPIKLTTNVTAVTNEKAENECQLQPTIKNNEFSLQGCWPRDKTPITIEMAIDNPRLLAANVVKQYLKQLNIKFNGDIVFAKAPQDLPLLASHQSPPLSALLFEVLAESNNIYTESLTKTLGLTAGSRGNFQAGTRAIKNILQKEFNLNFSQHRISDGSGQSCYNLISPELISQLLYAMYHDPLFEQFYSTLSVSGKTGTLANRLKDKTLEGKVVAKTGSLLGTSALSGYLTGNSGKSYVFVIMINQAAKESTALKAFEDKLCQLLIEEPWFGKP